MESCICKYCGQQTSKDGQQLVHICWHLPEMEIKKSDLTTARYNLTDRVKLKEESFWKRFCKIFI